MVKLILSLIFKSVILFALYLLGCRLPFINNILVVLFFYFIGQGLYKVFEDFLGKDDQVYKAALSITLGITAYFLSFLTLGHLGGAINRSSQLMLGILLLVVSEIILAFKTSIKTEYKKLERIDYVFWIVFVLFFGYCMFVINTYFFSPWDDFTYWLLDAKVIYEASKLRDSLRVLNLFNYTSYYPLHAVFIYNIFNRIAEQFASFFTVLYAALATIIIYRSNSNKPENTKILAVLLTLIVNMSFITNQMLLFCSYAEVVVAFNIMLFLHFLIKDYNDKNYPSRVFLLLLTLLIVFLIKTNNLYYCLVLSILWLFYDYRSIKDNLRSLISFKVIWFLLILTIIAISRYYYTHKIFINTVPGLLKPTEILPHNIFNLPFKYIRYSFFIFAHLTKNYLLSLLASFFIVLFALKARTANKRDWIILLVCSLLPLINIIHYITNFTDVGSQSLLRYTTTTCYCIPVLCCSLFVYYNINKFVVTRILYALLLVMVVWSFLILNHLIPLKGVPFHDGTYNEFHGAQFELANKIKEKIKDKNLLIMDSDGSNLVGNMGVPAIYTRYYLSQNNVGGQYSNRRDPIGYMKRIDPDYVLIESYNKVLIDYFKIKRTNVPALIKVKGVSKNTFEVTEL